MSDTPPNPPWKESGTIWSIPLCASNRGGNTNPEPTLGAAAAATADNAEDVEPGMALAGNPNDVDIPTGGDVLNVCEGVVVLVEPLLLLPCSARPREDTMERSPELPALPPTCLLPA